MTWPVAFVVVGGLAALVALAWGWLRFATDRGWQGTRLAEIVAASQGAGDGGPCACGCGGGDGAAAVGVVGFGDPWADDDDDDDGPDAWPPMAGR